MVTRTMRQTPGQAAGRPYRKAAGALLLFAALLPAFQTGNAGQEKKDAAPKDQTQAQKGSLEGTVLDAVSGKPVKDVTLLLAGTTGAGTPISGKSDEDGHFIFKTLDAGSYALIGDHPRYARQIYGSRNGLLGAALLTLSTGQEMKDVNFRLQPNAVVSGRILDEDGEPVPNVLVAVSKSLYQHGKRILLPVGNAMSNDLGEYRIANLAAGRYLLSATVMNRASAATPAGDQPETAYLATYYPNSTDSSLAAAVDVAGGRDVGGMDIKLVKSKAVRVKGKVLGVPKDQKATVRLVAKNGGLLASITGPNASVKAADGTFEVAGVTPGSYTLRVSDPTGMKSLSAGYPIEIADRAVDGVTIDVTPGTDLAGTVTVEGSSQTPVKGARVLLEATEGLSLVPPNSMVGEDGAFTLKELPPDKYLVRLANGPTNSYVESVQFGSQKMGEQGLDLGGSTPGKLEIKLRLGGAQVEGVVKGADDNPISGVTVALIPDTRRYLLYQSTFTDQKGGFRFTGVTPGDYKILSWEDVEPNAFQDPEFVKPFEGRAEAVSLKENDHKGVSLKVISRDEKAR